MAFEIEQPIDAGPSPVVEPTKPRLLGVLGPGLITGASDDDPSGIATYSQAGAQFGYALTFTYPLMTAVQIVSARMGRTTGRGIAGNLRTSSRFRSWSRRSRRCTPQRDRHPDLCPGSRSLGPLQVR
jgi:Natural resistance-associated macrophage protein